MMCVLQVSADPGQEAGLGPVVMVDLDHSETLQGLTDPFFKGLSYLKICKKLLSTKRESDVIVYQYSFSFKVSNEHKLI